MTRNLPPRNNLDGVSIINGYYVLHWLDGGEALIELPIGPGHAWYHALLQSLSGRIVQRGVSQIPTRGFEPIRVKPLPPDLKDALLNWLLDNPPKRDYVASDWLHKLAVKDYKRTLSKMI